MKNKILVLGYFGFVTNQLDGQTIKTRNIYELLTRKSNNEFRVDYFDTQIFKEKKITIFYLLWKIIKNHKIVYIPAQNNLKYFLPIVYILCKLTNTDILYIVVGGWLPEYIKKKKIHTWMLSRIKAIFPQNIRVKNTLQIDYNFKNVFILPNFRIQSFTPNFKNNETKILKLVFMARINRMKGIDTIFNALEELNKINEKAISLDFYGPIYNDDKNYFFTELDKFSNITYKGNLEPSKIYETFFCYDVMLLPTKYHTEGFPGSILDAYISGIPVIVTKWIHATEFVDNEETGYIVPFNNGNNEFINSIKILINNPEKLKRMKRNAYKKSKLYTEDKAWGVLKKYLS